MRTLALIVTALALLAAGAGCAAIEPEPPLERAPVQALRARLAKRKDVVPFRVAVTAPDLFVPRPASATARAAARPATGPASGASTSGSSASAATASAPSATADVAASLDADAEAVLPLPPDPLEAQRALVSDLRALGLFSSVEPVRPFRFPDDPKEARRIALAAADELRADVALIPRFRRRETAYVGTTGFWPPSLALGILFWVPTFFFPDERWAAVVHLEAELVYLRTGQTIWGPAVFRARNEGSFNDFERGFDVFGPWGIPVFTSTFMGVEERNHLDVADALLPATEADAAAALLLALGGYLERSPITPQGATPETVALVIGCEGPARGGVAPLAAARSDARAIATWLKDPQGGGVSARNLHLLEGEGATLAAAREFLAVETRRLSERDRLLVYVAAYGAVAADGKGYVALRDTDPRDLARTALPLDALLAVLRLPQAATVILDVGLGGSGGRTLPALPAAPGAAPAAAGKPLDRRPIDAAAHAPRGSFLVLACDAGETALEYVPEEHGVLTLVLLGALKDGDQDADGRVTLAEAFRRIEEEVPPASSVLGRRQRPLLLTADRDDAARRVLATIPRGPS